MLVSSLEKVFPKLDPLPLKKGTMISGLQGETISFQLAYKVENLIDATLSEELYLQIESTIKDQIKVRTVGLVPSLLPAYEKHDDNYITADPGVFPDLLQDFGQGSSFKPVPTQWRAKWIDVGLEPHMDAGIYDIRLRVKNAKEDTIWEDNISVELIGISLPEQRLIHTEWFHGDCLADYYNVDVFSETHWEIMEKQIEMATKHGINMILTPIFTPPLDTEVGGERTTIQLVDVYKDNESYTFNFDKLKRWIDICKNHQVKYLEMAHFFTQWGAKFTPKIMAWEDGVYRRIFGWDVSATHDSYKNFVSQFIPQLLQALKAEGFDETNTYFHVSDEPYMQYMDSYKAAKEVIADYLAGYKIIDALSSYDFYKHKLVENPIPASNHIQTFIDEGVQDLWVYYCCSQGIDVSNRFMAMPSARNRIMGIQLYVYDIKGFLHWGYNFYNAQFSKEKINPYLVTDAKEAFPSGDTFLVYPGEGGKPEASIRLMVFNQGLNDLRALELLEGLTSKAYVMDLIHDGLEDQITFAKYPKSASYIEDLRQRVNQEIKKRLG